MRKWPRTGAPGTEARSPDEPPEPDASQGNPCAGHGRTPCTWANPRQLGSEAASPDPGPRADGADLAAIPHFVRKRRGIPACLVGPGVQAPIGAMLTGVTRRERASATPECRLTKRLRSMDQGSLARQLSLDRRTSVRILPEYGLASNPDRLDFDRHPCDVHSLSGSFFVFQLRPPIAQSGHRSRRAFHLAFDGCVAVSSCFRLLCLQPPGGGR